MSGTEGGYLSTLLLPGQWASLLKRMTRPPQRRSKWPSRRRTSAVRTMWLIWKVFS
ncbi:hypothetical protein BJX61DRAFT_528925 [Aspergillus egyptiacus]|nr:hypothetical protein BJX61DRAFT_528925 [Aspergillus egyptiacus]